LRFVSQSKNPVSFQKSTLILPLLTLGNVGQLSVDLIVSTFSFEKIGLLDSEYVIPLIGNDTFTANGTGVLSTAVEVFQKPGITIVQQRAPVIKVCLFHYYLIFLS